MLLEVVKGVSVVFKKAKQVIANVSSSFPVISRKELFMARKSSSPSKAKAGPTHGGSKDVAHRSQSAAASSPAPAVPSSSLSTAAPSSGGGLMSGLAGTVMQGMAVGLGSSLAQRAVDSVLGPRERVVVHKSDEASSRCKSYEDALEQCKSGWFSANCDEQTQALERCRA